MAATTWAQSDFYGVLGLVPSCHASEVKKSFRRFALTCHPDKVPETEREAATQRFQLIVEAYEVLSSADRRRKYDAERWLAALMPRRAPAPAPAGGRAVPKPAPPPPPPPPKAPQKKPSPGSPADRPSAQSTCPLAGRTGVKEERSAAPIAPATCPLAGRTGVKQERFSAPFVQRASSRMHSGLAIADAAPTAPAKVDQGPQPPSDGAGETRGSGAWRDPAWDNWQPGVATKMMMGGCNVKKKENSGCRWGGCQTWAQPFAGPSSRGASSWEQSRSGTGSTWEGKKRDDWFAGAASGRGGSGAWGGHGQSASSRDHFEPTSWYSRGQKGDQGSWREASATTSTSRSTEGSNGGWSDAAFAVNGSGWRGGGEAWDNGASASTGTWGRSSGWTWEQPSTGPSSRGASSWKQSGSGGSSTWESPGSGAWGGHGQSSSGHDHCDSTSWYSGGHKGAPASWGEESAATNSSRSTGGFAGDGSGWRGGGEAWDKGASTSTGTWGRSGGQSWAQPSTASSGGAPSWERSGSSGSSTWEGQKKADWWARAGSGREGSGTWGGHGQSASRQDHCPTSWYGGGRTGGGDQGSWGKESAATNTGRGNGGWNDASSGVNGSGWHGRGEAWDKGASASTSTWGSSSGWTWDQPSTGPSSGGASSWEHSGSSRSSTWEGDGWASWGGGNSAPAAGRWGGKSRTWET